MELSNFFLFFSALVPTCAGVCSVLSRQGRGHPSSYTEGLSVVFTLLFLSAVCFCWGVIATAKLKGHSTHKKIRQKINSTQIPRSKWHPGQGRKKTSLLLRACKGIYRKHIFKTGISCSKIYLTHISQSGWKCGVSLHWNIHTETP